MGPEEAPKRGSITVIVSFVPPQVAPGFCRLCKLSSPHRNDPHLGPSQKSFCAASIRTERTELTTHRDWANRKIQSGKQTRVGRPPSAEKKFVQARGPQDWNPEVFDQTRCSRTSLHVEFDMNNREMVKAEVFEQRVFEQTAPLK